MQPLRPPGTLTRRVRVVPDDGVTFACRQRAGSSPGLLVLLGLKSCMTGRKVVALEELAAEQGRAFLCFDPRGQGLSGGVFAEGTIGRWCRDALHVLDNETSPGAHVVVGISVGGLHALRLASERPGRVAGAVLVAPAVGLVAMLAAEMDDARSGEGERRHGLSYQRPSAYGDGPYEFTREFVEDGRDYDPLLRNSGQHKLHVPCPVRILHGSADQDIDYRGSEKLLECIDSPDATLIIVDGADHRLSSNDDLRSLGRIVNEVLDAAAYET